METEDGAEGKNEDVGEEADLEPDLDDELLLDEPNAENVSNIFTFIAISLAIFGFPILPLNQDISSV